MEIELWIEKDHWAYTTRVWAREKTATRKSNIYYNDKGMLELYTMPQGCITGDVKLKPLMEMPTDLFNSIMGALVNELSRNGITPESESATTVRLKEMISHKNDLREIIKDILGKFPAVAPPCP